MNACLTESLELVVRVVGSGSEAPGVSFATIEAARKYLDRFQAAICGNEEERRTLGAWDWSVIESAWVAGEETGKVYCD